jgi:predicted ATPase
MLSRLERRLKLLTGGARDRPERQQTLRGAIDWSYDLLDEPEQRLFARLAVFAGGRTLDAIEAVCDPDGELGLDILDGLASLIDKSLLRQEENAAGQPRFLMLETIHEYARERLEYSGDADAVRLRHAHYFAALARHDDNTPFAAEWVRRLEPELPNLRLALDTFAEYGDAESEVRLAASLDHLWYLRGLLGEGRFYLERGLARGGVSDAARARLGRSRAGRVPSGPLRGRAAPGRGSHRGGARRV